MNSDAKTPHSLLPNEFVSDPAKLRAITSGLDAVIAVNCYLRSGSLFLQSLLDWHPDTITTPGIYMARFYAFFERNADLSRDDLIERFIEDFEVIFDGKGLCKADPSFPQDPETGLFYGLRSLGPGRDRCLSVSKEAFCSVLKLILGEHENEVSRKLFFQAVHVAYRYAQGQPGDINTETRIVYPIHTPIPNRFTARFVEDFPEAKHVMTIRQPIESASGMIKHLRRRGKPEFFLNAVMIPMLGGGCPIAPAARNNTIAVRLEDLHKAPRETMESLCDWLGLRWHDSLLSSTINGEQWWGDGNSLQVQGFSQSVTAPRQHDQLPSIDRSRLNVLLAPKNMRWGYDISVSDRSWQSKLMILPLLAVPFTMEVDFLMAERRAKLAFSSRNTYLERLPKPIVFLLWFCGLGTVYTYLSTRARLLRCWLGTFSESRSEAMPLERRAQHARHRLDATVMSS